MKINSKLAGMAAFGTAILLHATPVTLTVTPSVTSNSYSGVIALNIGGLTNSEQVIVQTYLDLNGNGIIDAGEPTMDAFKISDGGAMIIGGVTNINVPFDSNPAGGAITTSLHFAPPAVMENVVGRRIYKVVSPTGNFSPVTASLTVTNGTAAQWLSGTVYGSGAAPLPYAVVFVLPQDNGYVGAVVADAAGHYNLSVNPGAYVVMAAAPNYYVDQSAVPFVTLTNGMSSTNNVFLTNGTTSISGTVYETGNSNGIAGVMLQLQSGPLFAIAFSDANGNYSAAVAPNFWKIKPLKERLPRRAYVTFQNSLQPDTSTGSVAGANIGLAKGDALFYGRITDNASAPFANIEFDGGDGMNNLYSAKGVSDANGNYAVAVLGSVSGDWNASPSSSANGVLGNYVLNQFRNTNIVAAQAIRQDYVALPVTARIFGQVRDNLGNPVSGITMYADSFNGGNSYQSLNVDTDNSGNYTLGVASGAWRVNFSNGGEGSLGSQGLVDYFGPYNVTIPPTNALLNITVYQVGVPALSQPRRLSPTQFGFDLNGAVGVSYTVQTTTNLASANWVNLYSLQITNSPFAITDPNATNKMRFYRVLKN
jgi:hypothetical protein